MRTAKMGRVTVKARIENLNDLILVRAGHMKANEVRIYEVENALVDTGAAMLSMPKSLIKKLGLKKFTSRKMRTAKGSVMTHIYDAVRLTVHDRDCTIDVCEMAEGCPVLIGQVPLELLDFVVDPKRQKLIGNPEHGGEFMVDAF